MKKTVRLCLLSVLVLALACQNKKKSAQPKTGDDAFPKEMVEFVPYEGNPVFKGTGTNTWDRKIRERGYILYEDGLYKMWYSGYNPEMAKPKFMGYATSTDGINWTRYSDKPVFSEKWTEDMFVLKNDGHYYMFAEGDGDIAHLLVSADGINWKEEGDLVIRTTKGDVVPGPYGTPTAWIENGKWYLLYERNDSAIWIAGSEDKINWINIQDEPVLKPGPEAYDKGAIAADQLVKFKGKYYLYYHATDRPDWNHPASPVKWTSEVAMSTDLLNWIKYPGNPIVEGDHSSPILVFDGKKPSLYTVHSEVCRYSPK